MSKEQTSGFNSTYESKPEQTNKTVGSQSSILRSKNPEKTHTYAFKKKDFTKRKPPTINNSRLYLPLAGLSLQPSMRRTRSAEAGTSQRRLSTSPKEQVKQIMQTAVKILTSSPMADKNKNNTEIIPKKLYLGNRNNAKSVNFLDKHNIDAILTIAKTPVKNPQIRNYMLKEYKHMKFLDTQNSKLPFDEIADWIHEQIKLERTVLVHCEAGISRSPSAVISYYMKYKNMKFNAALDFVTSLRTCVNPIMSFRGQLLEWERTLSPIEESQTNSSSSSRRIRRVVGVSRQSSVQSKTSRQSVSTNRQVSTPF